MKTKDLIAIDNLLSEMKAHDSKAQYTIATKITLERNSAEVKKTIEPVYAVYREKLKPYFEEVEELKAKFCTDEKKGAFLLIVDFIPVDLYKTKDGVDEAEFTKALEDTNAKYEELFKEIKVTLDDEIDCKTIKFSEKDANEALYSFVEKLVKTDLI